MLQATETIIDCVYGNQNGAVTLCSLVAIYSLAETFCISLHGGNVIHAGYRAEFPPKYKYILQDFMALYPQKQKSSYPLLWEA
jgi:hypothetical protein